MPEKLIKRSDGMEMETEEQNSSYSATTRGILVSVYPQFLEAESNTASGYYAFAYTVTLKNLSQVSVQLVNRHWKVFSASRQIADVKGEGVVGEQPLLAPGEEYEYTSGSMIHDPAGYMVGSYTFRDERGEFFDVAIPKFDFIYVDKANVH